jgi:carboxyl-terminal processing protease
MSMKTYVLLLLVASCGSGSTVAPAPTAPATTATAVPTAPQDPAPEIAPPPPPAEVIPPERVDDVAAFDQVWTTIRDRHFDPTYGGLDWNAIRAELRPKVIAAKDRTEVRAILEDLIGRLKLTHFAIVPMGDDGKPHPEEEEHVGHGGVGLDVRPLDGGIVVTRVIAGGPAAKAGVKSGWMITDIGGKSLTDLLAPARAGHVGSSLLPLEEVGTVIGELGGRLDKTVDVTFKDGKGKAVKKTLGRTPPTGTTTKFGHLPPLTVDYESRRVGKKSDVAYVRLSVFFDPIHVLPAWQKDITALGEAHGIVLDLRGNPGGIGGMAMGMSGWLVKEVATLGTMKSREGDLKFVVNPQVSHYDGPVAILVDELSASTSEILAAGLQDLKRARVFGRRTPGAALPSQFERLPNGDAFQYAVATYVSSGGRTLEANGVIPDETIALDRKNLLAGKDVVLDAALRWITAQEKSP